uniref:Uncharacterized protein n=1 Tax=Knipowitschia caucasica TaxID=637954 RepID=A0AAV2IUI4_KNICA
MPLVVISQVDDKTGTGGERREKERKRKKRRLRGSARKELQERAFWIAAQENRSQSRRRTETGRVRGCADTHEWQRSGASGWTPPPFSPSSGAAKRWAKAAGPAEPRRHTTLEMR